MSRWKRRGQSSGVNGAYLSDDDDMPWVQGHSASNPRELDEEEWETFKQEQAEALARKRPVGFAPWPDA